MIRRTVTAAFDLGVPPGEAFPLFTARGEELWADGWRAMFPAEAPDDSAAGTVFVTEGDAGRSTWIVVDSERGRRMRYARVAGERTAGTVDVRLEPVAGGTRVTVIYDLTSLQPAADDGLDAFAAGYDDYLDSWRTAIEQHLRSSAGPLAEPAGQEVLPRHSA